MQLNNFPLTLEPVIDRHPLIVSPDTAVTEAITRMSQMGASCVLVIEQQRLVGIFTAHDVVKVAASGLVLAEVAIANVMTQPVISLSVTEAQNIFSVLSLLRQHRISHLPIVDAQSQVVGILTPDSIQEILQQVIAAQTAQLREAKARSPQEEVVQHAQHELEQRVEERTSELSVVNAQLRQEISDRLQLEEVLYQREQEFVSEAWRQAYRFFNYSIDLMVIADFNGYIRLANPAWEKVLGYTLDELKTTVFTELIHPDDLEATNAVWQEEKQENQLTIACENRYRCKDGSYKWLAWNCVPFPQEGLSYGFARDITERKQVEEALRQSEERYRQLFNSGNDAVFVHGCHPDGTVTQFFEVNNITCQKLGYSREELLQLSPSDLNAPEMLGEIPAIMQKIFAQKHHVFEMVILTKEGQRIPVEISAHLFEFNGQLTILSIVRDISDRQQAQAALRYRLEFEKLISSISTSFINLTSDELDAGINRALATVTEFSGFERSYVVLFSDDRSLGILAYEWHTVGVEPLPSEWHTIPAEPFRWWMAKLYRLEAIEAPCLDDLPPEANNERLALESLGMKSILVVPMVYSKSLIGYIGFGAVGKAKTWSEDSVALLRLVGEMFANALQRQRSEQALLDSERRFRAIFDQTFQFIGLLRPNGTVLECNQTTLDFCRVELDDLVDTPLWELNCWTLSTESQERVKAAVAQAAQGNFVHYETEVLGAGGKVLTIDFSLKPVKDEAGQVVLLIPEGHDITERKQAEEALRQSEERLDSILSSLEDVVWSASVTAPLKTLYCNSTVERIYGRPATEFFENLNLWSEVIYLEDRERVARQKLTVLERESVEVEYRIVRPNGKIRWIRDRSYLVRDTSGTVTRIDGIATDITERKQAEEVKEVLLKEIHHRVKNNMQLIVSLLDLQSQYVEDEQILQLLQASQARIRAMALIHETLYGSENLKEIDFRNYVHSLVGYLLTSYAIDINLITLTLDIEPISLNIDTAIACGLMINELISNTLKHAFPKGRAGEIAIAFHKTNDNQFSLIVRDNGVGLAEDLDCQNAGSLGLCLVHSLATMQLEGTLEIGGTHGAIFKITFPQSFD